MALASSFERHIWKAPKRLGVVLDFADLRAFLAGEALRKGADITMGTRYLKYEVVGN
ncbi:MAG: hypothetical protein KDK65_06850 [Chlamydiia bacterium]|nr:hypothetical protein [Chlamydiia bacterium]